MVGAAEGLLNENGDCPLFSLEAGAEGAEKMGGLEVSVDPVVFGTLRLIEGAEGAGVNLSAGLANRF